MTAWRFSSKIRLVFLSRNSVYFQHLLLVNTPNDKYCIHSTQVTDCLLPFNGNDIKTVLSEECVETYQQRKPGLFLTLELARKSTAVGLWKKFCQCEGKFATKHNSKKLIRKLIYITDYIGLFLLQSTNNRLSYLTNNIRVQAFLEYGFSSNHANL